MRRKKEQEYVFQVIEEPSHSLCKGCEGQEIRQLKDTLNLIYITIGQVTDYLGFEGNVKKRCKELTNWVRSNQIKLEKKNKKEKNG